LKIFHMIFYVLSLIFISLILLLSTSCEDEALNSNVNSLRISAPLWVSEKFKLDEAVTQFMAENPGIKVVIDKNNNYDTSYYPLMNKSFQKKYDIIIGFSREQIVSYAASGIIMDFDTDFFDNDLRKEDFFPSFLELGNINGKQYMIPLMGEIMCIVIRKDLFEKAGLMDKNGMPIPAKDWDQLYSYAKKLTTTNDKGQKIYGINIDFGKNMLLYSFYSSLQAKRGNIYDNTSSFIDISSNDTKYLLNSWQRLVKDGLAPVYTFEDMEAGRNNFKAGTVAMLLTAHSRWTEISAVLGEKNVGILPIPGAEKNGSLTYIHGITITSTSKNKDLAIKFIKQKLLSRDFQSWAMKKYGKIPSLISNYEVNLSPEWNSILTWVRNASTLPIYKDWPKIDKVLQLEIQNCVTGKQTPDQTVNNLTAHLKYLEKSSGF